MSKGLNLPQAVFDIQLYHGFVDHFSQYVSGDLWTLTSADSGTAAIGDAAGGIMTITGGDGTAADNDEAYLHTTKEIFLIAAGKPLHFRSLLKYTEVSTNTSNIIAGTMNAISANSLVDNGAGPKTDFSGAAFFKVDGGLNWNVIYSDGTTQTKAELTATNSLTRSAKLGASAAYQLLEIDIIPKTSTLVDVIFSIDGSTVYKMMDRTYASATEMMAGMGAKNGTTSNASVLVDAAACYQKL